MTPVNTKTSFVPRPVEWSVRMSRGSSLATAMRMIDRYVCNIMAPLNLKRGLTRLAQGKYTGSNNIDRSLLNYPTEQTRGKGREPDHYRSMKGDLPDNDANQGEYPYTQRSEKQSGGANDQVLQIEARLNSPREKQKEEHTPDTPQVCS